MSASVAHVLRLPRETRHRILRCVVLKTDDRLLDRALNLHLTFRQLHVEADKVVDALLREVFWLNMIYLLQQALPKHGL